MKKPDYRKIAEDVLKIEGLPEEVYQRARDVLKSSVPELALRRLLKVASDAMAGGGCEKEEELLRALRIRTLP